MLGNKRANSESQLETYGDIRLTNQNMILQKLMKKTSNYMV